MKVVIEDVVRNDSHTDFRAGAFDERQHFAVFVVSLGNDALSRASIAHVIHEATRCYSTFSSHGDKRAGKPLASVVPSAARSKWGQTPEGAGKGRHGV